MNIDAQTWLWVLAAAAALMVVWSNFAEKRQAARKNLDRPGWVPWPLVQIISIIVVVVAAVLALKQ